MTRFGALSSEKSKLAVEEVGEEFCEASFARSAEVHGFAVAVVHDQVAGGCSPEREAAELHATLNHQQADLLAAPGFLLGGPSLRLLGAGTAVPPRWPR